MATMTAEERAKETITNWRAHVTPRELTNIDSLVAATAQAIQAAERDMAERVKRIVMDYRNKFGMDTEAQAVILERIAAMQNEVRP